MKRFQLLIAVLVVLVMSFAAHAVVEVTHIRTIGTVDSVEMIKDVTITMDNSYSATPGEALTEAALGLTSIYSASCQPEDGYVARYDYANDRIIVYWVDNTTDGAALVEVTAAQSLASVVFPCRITGK